MTAYINFESLSYNPFSIHESAINSEHDPDINFYQGISSLETHYCSPNDFQNNFQCFLKEKFYSKNFIRQLTSNLALFVFQKHGYTTHLSTKIRIFNF